MGIPGAGLSLAVPAAGELALTATFRITPTSCVFVRKARQSDSARYAGIDPDFDHPHAVSPVNKGMRDAAIDFLESKLGEHPELTAKMTPEYPVFGARPIIVDAAYSIYDAILRDNVTLVTDGIQRMNERGIETNNGTQYDLDAIVYATGFHATEYLFPMTITGRNGQTIEACWNDGGARAHRLPHGPRLPEPVDALRAEHERWPPAGRFRRNGHALRDAVHRRADPHRQALDRAKRRRLLALRPRGR